MKKNYIFTLLLTFCFNLLSFGQVFITELADPDGNVNARYIELYNIGTTAVDLTGWRIDKYTNEKTEVSQTLALTGTVAAGEFYIIGTGLEDSEIFDVWGVTPDLWDAGANNVAGSNGDDNLELYNASNVLVDQFGVPGEDGTGTNHEFEDGRAERKSTVTSGSAVWDVNEWNIDNDGGAGDGALDTSGGFDPRFWIGTITEPALSVSGATDGKVFSPETTVVPLSFSLQNFTLSGDNGFGESDNTGDGYIVGTLVKNGQPDGTTNIFTNSLVIESNQPANSFVLTFELVDNGGVSLDPKVEQIISFSVASYIDVANLELLRAATEGGYYNLTGEVYLTYARSSRNQKYIQDDFAGILIDDSEGTITTDYNTYDGITGLKGRLSSFSGTLQFLPDADPGVASSTGNTVSIETVSLADLVANPSNYESKLINIENVSFAAADVDTDFTSSTNYPITVGETSSVFRTNFSEADYIGTTIPAGAVAITGLGAQFNGSAQLVALNLAGFVLGTQDNQIEGFATYPNPVTGKEFTVSSANSDVKQVAIFNVLGKTVLSAEFSGTKSTIDISNINSGIYILKVTEAGKTTTKKLVIR